MSEVKLPEPVGYMRDKYGFKSLLTSAERVSPDDFAIQHEYASEHDIQLVTAEQMEEYAEQRVREALRQAKRIVMDGPLYMDSFGEMPYFDESGKAMSVTIHSQLCRFEEECFAKYKP